ncbi:flavin reductase family protein [Peptostreptococcus faecalis]|uniref:flavin reductase family protein n=1 Tax=Peptostreptococcus faecalis TaxID=2045015 RepID=UPI000C79DF7C|nr:flavin reductase [Peptostreptococcus faecalis]
MKKEVSIFDRPEKLAGYDIEQYVAFCGNLSWYDFVTAMPSLVFVVTGWKSNGKENACLHSWSSFMGSGLENFICILGKVNKDGHMYQSLKETKVCVLNFPSNDIYDRCVKTISNNQFEIDEITASGLTAEKAAKVNAPQIKECFLNIECEYLWEQELFEGSKEVAIAVRAVNICMDSEYYDQTKLGRYGKNGYLYYIDQPTNPETGEITPVGPGTMEAGNPIEWITE